REGRLGRDDSRLARDRGIEGPRDRGAEGSNGRNSREIEEPTDRKIEGPMGLAGALRRQARAVPWGMAREPQPTWLFAVVAWQLGHRCRVGQGRKHGQQWYLRAGRIEPGESFVEEALRETVEESGIPVAIDGVIRVEHTPGQDG